MCFVGLDKVHVNDDRQLASMFGNAKAGTRREHVLKVAPDAWRDELSDQNCIDLILEHDRRRDKDRLRVELEGLDDIHFLHKSIFHVLQQNEAFAMLLNIPTFSSAVDSQIIEGMVHTGTSAESVVAATQRREEAQC